MSRPATQGLFIPPPSAPPREEQSSKSRHRVLVLAPQPFYEDRGTPIAVRHVLTALSDLGHSVDLLTFPMGEPLELPGLRILRAGPAKLFRRVPIGFSIRKLLLDLAMTFALWRLLRREKYSHIHAVEEAAFPAAILGARRGIPLIYDMQSSLPEQLLKHWYLRAAFVQRALRKLERWLVHRADVVVCSAGLANHVRSLRPSVHVREWRYPVSPHRVSRRRAQSLRKQLNIAPQRKVVLYTGNFEEYQGLSLLLEATPLVISRHPEVVLVLVGGNGSDVAQLPAAAQELHERGELVVVGRQSRALMPQYMAMADVLVAPRQAIANVPLKVFDYLAAGKPMVATDCPAHRAVLTERTAELAPATAPEFAEAIVRLLEDRRRAGRICAAARMYVYEHLGWAAFVGMIDDTYERAHRGGKKDVAKTSSGAP